MCADEVKGTLTRRRTRENTLRNKTMNLQKQFTEIPDGDGPPRHHRRHLSTKNGVSYDPDSLNDEKE